MNFSRISAVVLAVVVPVIAHAQMNQLFGALQSVQNAASQAKQFLPQQSGQDSMQNDQRVAAQAQAGQTAMQQQEQDQQKAFRAAQLQRAQAGKQRAQQVVADQDAKDIAKYKESQQRDQQQTQQQLDAARKIAGMCPDLTDTKFNVAERMIRCRNKGLTEDQQMTFVSGLPVLAQAYAASIAQDIYEDNVTNPGRGKAISDYYNDCFQRGTPCARPKW